MRSILACVLIAFAPGALAHDAASGWAYDPFCCNGDSETGDCQMIPSKSVKVTPNGYRVTLVPGDHRLVTRYHVFLLPLTKAMQPDALPVADDVDRFPEPHLAAVGRDRAVFQRMVAA